MITFCSEKFNNSFSQMSLNKTQANNNAKLPKNEKSDTFEQKSFIQKNKKEIAYTLSGIIIIVAGIIVGKRLKNLKKIRENKPPTDTPPINIKKPKPTPKDQTINHLGQQQQKVDEQIQNILQGYKELNPNLTDDFLNKLSLLSDKNEYVQKNFANICLSVNKNNNEFLSKKGLDLFIDKMDKVDSIISNPENKYQILKKLNEENVEVFSELPNNPKRYKITHAEDINIYLENIIDEKMNYAFNEILPLFEKYQDNYKFDCASDLADILGFITPKSSQYIELVAQNADKIGLGGYHNKELLKAINEQNKDCVPLIADNAKKLGIDFAYDVNDFESLLNKGKDEIQKLINK